MPEDGSAFRLIFWIVILIALVIGAGAGLLVLRKRMLEDRQDPNGPALTLHDLRTHHREGRLSDEEFEAAKAAIIGQAKSTGKASSQNPNKA